MSKKYSKQRARPSNISAVCNPLVSYFEQQKIAKLEAKKRRKAIKEFLKRAEEAKRLELS